ncbi:hypothetical protein FJZ40_00765 [Candidatus Shapirobacteria bacterium]|nr:hypothetical protein [Candidatus Shapirobacteria bacterium]
MIKELLHEFKEYPRDYLFLGAVFLLGILSFFFFAGTLSRRKTIVLVLAGSYILWGIIHHYQKKDLHLWVALEYFLIALLGLVVCFSLFSLL